MICYLFPEPIFFFFSNDVPALLYYAQIPATAVALFFGLYVFVNGRKFLLNRLLLVISIFFSLWVLATLISWTNINSNLIMFVWSFFGIILSFISIFCIYFIYVFLEKKDISTKIKVIFLSLLSPVIILTPTSFNLSGFNITNCDAFDFEWYPLKIYVSLLGFLAMVWIFILLIRKYRISTNKIKKQIILIGIGIEFFLFSFFGMEFLATYLKKIGILPDSGLELYGLLGMVIFIIYISILIIRYGIFNIKLMATQALIWGLVLLIGSQFFFIKVTINFFLNGITFVGIIIFGQFLINSVKKEVEQREKLEILTNELYEANVKLQSLDKLKTEFVSLASHQLRSPLTVIKGYTSMLIEGDYGEINPKAFEIVGRVQESSNNLTMVVEDLLNVAKIEQGGMKYEMDKVDFGELTRDTARDLSIVAEKKGLKLTYGISEDIKYFVNGDKEKLRQILINLIDNSMKYTKEGHIEVNLNIKDGKILLSIKDTGVGISKEVIGTLFQKFSRGDGARQNSTGSGLGLYLVKEIIEAHHGRVWIESEGEGKGSTFFVEINEIK
ncbi:MAG: ATP-binding protein [Candidatus Nomurabacteria bacterium]|nr:ATP-binding protein [Candidatus Nomurabacteria bacterium]